MPNAAVTAVVEPWFLGAGADSPPGKAFAEWAEAMKEKGVAFCDSVDAVPVAEGERTLALISGRTADNPRLLKEVIEKGCTAVYLEKPGAPTVKELEEMRAYANSKGVPVFMGYNKNVTPYVRKARRRPPAPSSRPAAASGSLAPLSPSPHGAARRPPAARPPPPALAPRTAARLPLPRRLAPPVPDAPPRRRRWRRRSSDRARRRRTSTTTPTPRRSCPSASSATPRASSRTWPSTSWRCSRRTGA